MGCMVGQPFNSLRRQRNAKHSRKVCAQLLRVSHRGCPCVGGAARIDVKPCSFQCLTDRTPVPFHVVGCVHYLKTVRDGGQTL